MKVVFTEQGWEEFPYWMETDRRIALKITGLIRSIRQDAFRGMGKPEPLRHTLAGCWSRRITGEHRLVYQVSGKGDDQICAIIQCRFHYDDKK